MPKVALTDRGVSAAKAEKGERLELHDALTPGLTLRVTDKGVKSWVLRYRTRAGESRRHRLGDAARMGLRAARLEAGRLKDLIDKGGDPLSEKRAAVEAERAVTVRTVGDLLDAYWTACEAGRWKPRKKTKRAATLDYERGIARRHIEPALGKTPLADVKRQTVRGLLDKMTAKGIGAQTNRTHALLRQIFNFAIAEELIGTNPAMGFESPHDQKARRRVWSDDELKVLWETLQSPIDLHDSDGNRIYVGRPVCIALQLCAVLLQRRVEVAGMRTDEIDFVARTWVVPAERMKAGVPHLVPLTPRAIELIEEAISLAQDRAREAKRPLPNAFPIFPGHRDTEKSIRADSLSQAMDRVRSCIGVESATIHDLRRTGSSAMTSERLGVSPFIRSKVLGHTTDTGGGAAVSSAHYDVNLYVAEKRRALEAWEGLLLEIVGERK